MEYEKSPAKYGEIIKAIIRRKYTEILSPGDFLTFKLRIKLKISWLVGASREIELFLDD